MLAKAAATAPSITWRQADLATWRPDRPADLIYSNAALHWLPGHERLFPALLRGLAPGGVLAVQMPRNFGARSHTAIAEAALGRALARHARAAAAAGPGGRSRLLLRRPRAPRGHARHLGDRVPPGARGRAIRSRSGPRAPGSSRCWTPSRSRSAAASRRAYAALVAQAYPPRADGRTLFPFRRLFIVARARQEARHMKIDRIDVYWVKVPLAFVWKTSYADQSVTDTILVRMEGGGHYAWGESCPPVHPGLLRRAHAGHLPHPARAHGPAHHRPGHRDRAGSAGPAGLHQGQPVRAGRARHRLVGARRQAARAAAAPRPRRRPPTAWRWAPTSASRTRSTS